MIARIGFCTVLLATGLFAQTASTNPNEPSSAKVFPQLMGSWSCEGTFQGQPATATASFTMVSGNLHLEYQLLKAGRAFFKGTGIYQSKTLKGVWVDSAGNAYVLKTTFTADSMATEWKDFESVRGFSLYRLADANTLNITDEVNGKDGRRPFVQLTCKR